MLEIKQKNLDRREWYNDTQRTFKCRYFKDDFFEGGVGLITFTGLEEPEIVDSPKGKLCIGDNGYQWLELAPVGGNYVVTTMFCDNKIFQHYVDITLRNEVTEDGNAVFYDLFLDVVVDEDGRAMLIDDNELDEAYAEGAIGDNEYSLAKEVADSVLKLFSEDRDKLERKICEYLRELNDNS